MIFAGALFFVGLSFVIVALILVLLTIGIGPTTKTRRYGWRDIERERDLEEDRAKEESD